MKVLGVRASAQEIRYAILESSEAGSIEFLNQKGEHRLIFPATIEDIAQRLLWIKGEFDRILRQSSDIDLIVIKMNEYTGTENGAKRETNYVDAACLLCAAENKINVERKLNSQIGSTFAKAKGLAEQRVGKTDHHWNNTMADAILAAFWRCLKDK